MPVFIWDASDYDWTRGPMDVGAAVRDGIVGFTHKGTEGTRIQHAHYGEALNRARAAAMPVYGAYMIPRTPGNSGHGSIPQQVAYFLAYLDAQTPWWRSTPEFFIQVDTEHWGYDNVDPTLGAQACTLLRAQTGKWVIHYAPRWSYGDTIPGSDPLWESAYGSNPAVPYRQAYPGDNWTADSKGHPTGWAPYSGRTPTFLQYGSRLTIGNQPGCDGSAFRGTLDQLIALVTGGSDMATLDPAQWQPLADTADRVWAMYSTQVPALTANLKEMAGDVAALKASEASESTAIAGLKAALDTLAAVINKGSGNIDVATITAAVETAAGEVKTLVEQRHTDEMAALKASHDAQVAALQAQVDALKSAAS